MHAAVPASAAQCAGWAPFARREISVAAARELAGSADGFWRAQGPWFCVSWAGPAGPLVAPPSQKHSTARQLGRRAAC